MEDTLKRLLEAELEAETIVDQALEKRDRLIEQAREEARSAEERLDARLPELRASFMSRAEERARQAIAESERRYGERHEYLKSMAQERREEATREALAIILDPSRA